MKKIMIILSIILAGLTATPVMAVDNSTFNPICDDSSGATENQRIEAGCDREGQDNMGRVTNIINVAIGLTGLIAVVVIVFGGQRYLTSAGDAGKVKQAKDMVMYGLIGLVVAALAWAVVNFLIGSGVFNS